MRKVWDHTIDLKEEFIPRKGKVYPLSREEREEIREFITEQIRKWYIRLSKLLQTVSVFFVEKKDGKKNGIRLFEWTVKNNYPLLLILDMFENIGTKKIFTKIDLR